MRYDYRTIQSHKWKFAKAYALDFENRSRERLAPNESLDDHLQNHLYFITLVGRGGTHFQMRHFSKLYFDTCRDLLGRKLKNKQSQQPYGYAFIDFENSRSGRWFSSCYWTHPHIHAVLLVPPEINGMFSLTMDFHAKKKWRIHPSDFHDLPLWQRKQLEHHPDVNYQVEPWHTESIEIRKFNLKKASLTKLLSYCSKGYCLTSAFEKNHGSFMEVFPKIKTEK